MGALMFWYVPIHAYATPVYPDTTLCRNLLYQASSQILRRLSE